MRLALCTLCVLLSCAAVRAQAPTSSPATQGSGTATGTDINIKAPAELAHAPGADAPVPLSQEPHHRLLFQNSYARVYDVAVPPLDSTYLHQHDLPYIGITLGTAELTNVVVGKPEAQVTLQDGETRYFSGGYAHLVRTDFGVAFRNITIEFLHPQGTARNICKQVMDGPLGACPQQAAGGKNSSAAAGDDDVPYFETDELRIDHIQVAQGRDYVDAAPKWNGLLVALTGANLDADLGGEHVSFLHTGNVLWLPAGVPRKVVDFLGTKSSFILVSFKDSAEKSPTQ